MTDTPAPLPAGGGSWIRDESGALRRAEEAPVKGARKPDPKED